MSQENVDLVTGAYDDFNAGNPDGVLARLAPDVEWTEPDVGGKNAPSGTFTGPDSVGNDVFAKVGENFDEFTVNIENARAEGDDKVVVEMRFKGKSKSGKELDAAAAQTWEVRDGKIASMNNEIKDTDNFVEAWS